MTQPHVKRYYIMVDIEAEEETKSLGGCHAGRGSTNADALNSSGDYFAANDNPNLQDDAYSTNRFAALLKD